MKNLNIRLFLCVFALAFKSYGSEVFKNFTAGRFDSNYSFVFFKTEANFSSDGNKVTLPTSNYYQISNINLAGRYVLANDFGIYTSVNIGSAESSNLVATRKNSTLNQATLGIDYLIFETQTFAMYADLSYTYAIEKVKADTDSVMNSDGADQVKAQLTGVFDLDGFYPYGRIGVNYKNEGLASLLTYAGGLELRYEQVALGAGVDGYLTIKEDTKTNQSFDRDIITSRVNAGSKTFYGVNPNHLDSDIYLKYNFDEEISLKVNGGYSLIGSNSAQGYHAGIAFAWGFGGRAKPKPRLMPVYREVPTTKAKPAPRFEEDTNDGVNQDYFKTVKPSQDNYIKQVEPSQKLETAPSEMPAAPPGYKVKLKKVIKVKRTKKTTY
jgi:hypothetical protein